MKYVDVEKLKAEIERFSATEYGDNTLGDDVANNALDYVLEEIIPSLQQELKIWHNVSEEVPQECGRRVLVACKNKNKEDGIWLYDLIQCWEGKWEPRVNWEDPVKWAYVDELD